jgi:YVTN family beta-propeller protein
MNPVRAVLKSFGRERFWRFAFVAFLGATLPLPTAPVVSAGTGPFAYITNAGSNTVSVIDSASNTVVATVAVGTTPIGVAVNPAGTRAYVANAGSNTVSVIETATNTVVATVAVGAYPYGVAVNPAGTRAYVANQDSSNVSVIDTATNTVVATVAVGGTPRGVAVNPAGTRVYVTNNASHNVSVIDTASNTVVATVAVGTNPFGVAFNPAGTRAYVANQGGNNVSVIDTASNTVVATVAVGTVPNGVGVNPAGTRAYVGNQFSNNVSVIDTATNTVIATVAVGSGPVGVAVNPAGTRAYVANLNGNNVSVIDTGSNTVVATVAVGAVPYAFGVFITPGGTPTPTPGPFAYITNHGSHNVSVIDTASNTVVATVAVGFGPLGVAVNPAGTRAYVGNYRSSNVSVIDTATNTAIATVAAGANPTGVAVNPAGTRAYVADEGNPGTVSVIDTATNTVVATVAVGANPEGVAVNPAGTRAYVANLNSNTVSVIDTASNTVVATVAVGTRPLGVVVNPAGTRAYVANQSSNVSVIDTATNTVVATVAVGLGPFGVAVNPAGTRAYVANAGSDTVSVIDTASNTVVATVAVGDGPRGVAVTPAGTRTYVANQDSNNVSVIDTATNTVVATVAVGTSPAAFGLFITPGGTPTPTCVSPPANMISWWPGDGNANDIADGNPGTLIGAVTFGAGKVGQGFKFADFEQRVEVPAASNLRITGPMTLDAWVTFNAVVDSVFGNAPIAAKWGDTNHGTGGYGLFVFSNGRPFFAVSLTGGDVFSAVSPDALAPGQTAHIAGVWTGTELQLYVDGILKANTAFSGPIFDNGTIPLLMGAYNPSLTGFNPAGPIDTIDGVIDEVEVFNRALSQTEIQAIYNAGSAGMCKTAKTDTTTTITSNTPNPSVVGQVVSVTFAVSTSAGTPTGTVTVSDGAVTCTATVAAGTCSVTFTSSGSTTLTATYAGDTNFNGSTSASVSQTVNTPDTTAPTTVASVSPAANGPGWNKANVTVTLTATDNTGGSGVQSITYTLSGAQGGAGSATAATTSVTIATEGTTTVTYHARDVAGNVESDKTVDILLDTTAPAVTVPANMTVNATSPSGAVATFTPTATDATSGVASLTSSPASGSTFPLGTTTVTVTATDTAGNTSTASFTVTVSATPVASNDSYSLAEDTTLVVTAPGILGNDTDIDSPTLTAILVSGPTMGALGLNANGSFTYTPNANVNGTDSFTYRASDGSLTSNLATVTLTVTAVNDLPVLAPIGAKSVSEGQVLQFTLSATDVDGDSLTFTAGGLPAGATFNPSTRAFSYTPTFDVSSSSVQQAFDVVFSVSDGKGGTASETVRITVLDVPGGTVAGTNVASQPIDTRTGMTPVTLTFANVIQPGVTSLTTSTGGAPPPTGFKLGTPATYYDLTTTATFSGSITVCINYTGVTFKKSTPRLFHLEGGVWVNRTVSLDTTAKIICASVTSLSPFAIFELENDAPVANGQSVITAEDAAVALALTGSDVDGDALTFAIVSGPAHGTLSGTPPNLTYTPTLDFNGSDSFTFTVSDGRLTSAPATVAITVTLVEDLPGRMTGDGHIDQNGLRHHFEFQVRERADDDQRGRLQYRVRQHRPGRDRDDDDDDDGRRGPVNRFVSTVVTAVNFTDDPTVTPGRRQQASVDTVVFIGTGRWNGAPGYTFEARATDAREPGRGRDHFMVTIRNPGGAIMSTVTGTLSGGNVQSHRVRR